MIGTLEDSYWIMDGSWMDGNTGDGSWAARGALGAISYDPPTKRMRRERKRGCVRFAICLRECCHIQQETVTTAPCDYEGPNDDDDE